MICPAGSPVRVRANGRAERRQPEQRQRQHRRARARLREAEGHRRQHHRRQRTDPRTGRADSMSFEQRAGQRRQGDDRDDLSRLVRPPEPRTPVDRAQRDGRDRHVTPGQRHRHGPQRQVDEEDAAPADRLDDPLQRRDRRAKVGADAWLHDVDDGDVALDDDETETGGHDGATERMGRLHGRGRGAGLAAASEAKPPIRGRARRRRFAA